MRRWVVVVVACGALVAASVPVAQARVRPFPIASTAYGHLEAIVDRSPAPEYRRYGSPGIRHVEDYAQRALAVSGYATAELHTTHDRWWVDYAAGHEPMVQRTDTGQTFATDSAFGMAAVTTADGITCTVAPYDAVQPGQCGFVPFPVNSPEWKNFQEDTSGALAAIVAAGGVGAILQGDVSRGALVAHRTSAPIPVVTSVVDEADVVGHEVRLRAMGGWQAARSYDVVGVRRPVTPGRGYVLLLAHIDGWFTAAADNGGGAAAVLRAAQLLAPAPPGGAGVAVALVDGEEVGYIGSGGLVARLQSAEGVGFADGGPALHMADIESVVNLDAPSAIASETPLPEPFSWRVLVHTADATALQGVGTFAAAGVLGLPVEASVATQLNGGITRTDAGLFADAGKPVIWPVAGYPEYHTTADTLAVVDPVDLENVAIGAASTVRLLGR